jgi:hypothetical protein
MSSLSARHGHQRYPRASRVRCRNTPVDRSLEAKPSLHSIAPLVPQPAVAGDPPQYCRTVTISGVGELAPTDRLAGLNRQERAACLIAERVLRAEATPWDVNGRQGAVDAMFLTLPGDRTAAFEVTNLMGTDQRVFNGDLGSRAGG